MSSTRDRSVVGSGFGACVAAPAYRPRLKSMVNERLRNRCALCALVPRPHVSVASVSTFDMATYLDDQLIWAFGPGLLGVVLAARVHDRVLDVGLAASGTLLAALRQAVAEVQRCYEVSGAMIETFSDLPGASGHVCYHVVPSLRVDGVATLPKKMEEGSGRLAGVLRAQVDRRRMGLAVDDAWPGWAVRFRLDLVEH